MQGYIESPVWYIIVSVGKAVTEVDFAGRIEWKPDDIDPPTHSK